MRLGLAILLLLTSIVGPALAGPDVARRIPFQLTERANYQEGCFGPLCMCPLHVQEEVTGRFTLVPAGHEDGFEVFRVRHLSWHVPKVLTQPEALVITGTGEYRIDRRHGLQSLELDLHYSGTTTHFESGVVDVGDEGGIDVTVSIHGMECYDHVFVVNAAPVRYSTSPADWPWRVDKDPDNPESKESWSTLKGRFGG